MIAIPRSYERRVIRPEMTVRQVAADYSTLLEWLALVLFTITCIAMMYHGESLLTKGQISTRTSLAKLLAEHPWIEDRLIARGIGYFSAYPKSPPPSAGKGQGEGVLWYWDKFLGRARSVPQELTIGSVAESEGCLPGSLLLRSTLGFAHCGLKRSRLLDAYINRSGFAAKPRFSNAGLA